ncbi:MAG TPA: HPP family protein [Rhodothermales bacterium]|nr:HPP family protein [Rhodothermales bacterium]
MKRPASIGRHWIPKETLWSPLVVAAVMLAPGLVGLAFHRLVLFPSLGPTALLMAHFPDHRTTRFYNVVVSHLLGLGSGFLAVIVLGLQHAPSVVDANRITLARVVACILAIALATGLELVFDAVHPPGAATTLLVALGTFKPSLRDTATVIAGVLIVAAIGDVARRVRLRQKAAAARAGIEESTFGEDDCVSPSLPESTLPRRNRS